jgi:hypothetical protein
MVNNYCIYRHLKLCGEVFYIGIGKKERAYQKYKSNRNKYWWNITQKYNYEVQILKSDLTWEEAQELEKILISWYGRKDLNQGTLVNMTDGGDGIQGYVYSKETRKKLSLARKNKPISKEHIEAIRNANIGRIPTEETRLKISKKLKEIVKPVGVIKKRKIINVITGRIYNSINECSREEKINYSTLWRQLTGNTTSKCNFKYLEDYDK